ncbi:uncharacterized protein LOC111694764 isoform X3 [Eurytemora carolleeae]|uniref:uncharacterized protein LOC111694764 isoform X3 n=2 Tax=Eurytemora carolleeae TaxID=1294199 RepID=UPI000C77876C|nr:uncharacterized protein LOC111694764 isoform X3 [Eurytemora carolleeae]|eukprot:XP_023319541.1 uncharacterized protein LOC111694764 isoform X3 [Eurytemora affinis]
MSGETSLNEIELKIETSTFLVDKFCSEKTLRKVFKNKLRFRMLIRQLFQQFSTGANLVPWRKLWNPRAFFIRQKLYSVDMSLRQLIPFPVSDMSSLETVSIISLLKTSHILLFDDVSRRSEETLLTRVEQEIPGSCLQVLLVAGELGLSNLKKISLRLAVDKFDKLNIEDLASLDEETLSDILLNPDLDCRTDSKLISVLQSWTKHWSLVPQTLTKKLIKLQISLMEEISETCNLSPAFISSLHLEYSTFLAHLDSLKQIQKLESEMNLSLINEMIPYFQANIRDCIVFPCILAYRVPDSQDGNRRRNTDRRWICFQFDPRTAEFRERFGLDDICNKDRGYLAYPTGCRVTSSGSNIYISGGAFDPARNWWNLHIFRISFPSGTCEIVGKLSEPRRHHSAVIIGCYLYLLGGFNKTRVILNTVVRINLTTGEEFECASLPSSMYKLAATEHKGNLVVVRGGSFYTYYPTQDTWKSIRILSSSIPEGIEFHSAIGIGSVVYLTSTYCTGIYRLPLCVETEIDKAVPEEDLEKNNDLSEENISLEKVGDLKKEAQHLCSIGSNLCNFYMEEFSGERTIEVFNSSKGSSEIVWSVDDCNLEFSSQACTASFSVNKLANIK